MGTLQHETSRLLLVSNRLPVTVRATGDDQYECYSSAGGLVSGLNGLLKTRSFQWYGWPGLDIPASRTAALEEDLKAKYSAFPVWLDDWLADKHYNGLSNSTLWPLLHYRTDSLVFEEQCWRAYEEVNYRFADVIATNIQHGDLIWIHDYHLFLLPKLLRQALAQRSKHDFAVKIGFFLHTPFPAVDVFNVLPVCRVILESLLQCDLLGFHVDSYAQNFKDTCAKVLRSSAFHNDVRYKGKTTRVRVLPIGIEPVRFVEALSQPMVQQRASGLKRIFQGRRIICGVDRLDFIKGIPHKLRAFETLLTQHPHYVGKVCLVQVVVPSREALEENRDLKAEIDFLAKCINDKYRSLGFLAVHILHRQVCFDELVSLYAASDVCVISSLRDGMNLVSKEYIASQSASPGCLILSEFAGAAQGLKEALLVNPWDRSQFAAAYATALDMSLEERQRRWKTMYDNVTTTTSAFWGEQFIAELENEHRLTERRRSQAGLAGQDMSEYYAS